MERLQGTCPYLANSVRTLALDVDTGLSNMSIGTKTIFLHSSDADTGHNHVIPATGISDLKLHFVKIDNGLSRAG